MEVTVNRERRTLVPKVHRNVLGLYGGGGNSRIYVKCDVLPERITLYCKPPTNSSVEQLSK